MELCNSYIEEHCELLCKKSTINLYKGYVNVNLVLLHNKKAKNITKREIDLLIVSWKQGGMKNKSINNLTGFVYSVFKHGISNKWIKENPMSDVKKLPKEKRDVRFFDEDEIQEYLKIIATFPFKKYIALLTLLETGMRISEFTAIEWSDINFKKLTISINKQYYKGKLTTPKTYTSTRIIDISPSLADLLLRLKRETTVLSKIVFCGRTGGYMNQEKFIKNWFKKATAAVGKPEYNIHSLRHTHATFLLQNGVPINYVSERLGHSSPQTTLNVYSHVMPKITNQAMNLFEKIKKEHFKSIEISERVEAQQ